MTTLTNHLALGVGCNSRHQSGAAQPLCLRAKAWSQYQSRRSALAGQRLLHQSSTTSRHNTTCRSAGKLVVTAETSYIMIKPDGVQRALVGEIVQRFERKGFTLKALKMFRPSKELAEEHYKDLSSKPFFGKLVDYIISGPVIAMVSNVIYICGFERNLRLSQVSCKHVTCENDLLDSASFPWDPLNLSCIVNASHSIPYIAAGVGG